MNIPQDVIEIGKGGIVYIVLQIYLLKIPKKNLSLLLQIKNGSRPFEKEQVASPYPKKKKNDQPQKKLKGELFLPSTLPLKKQQIKELYSPQFLSATIKKKTYKRRTVFA